MDIGKNMAVDYAAFVEWATDRFGAENIKLKTTNHGTEVCTHSYFAHRLGLEDSNYHLWMNPSGGKSDHPEKGSYRCWKTDAMGSLVKLVAEWDGIDYDDAEELICGTTTLKTLAARVHEYFEGKDCWNIDGMPEAEQIDEPRPTLELPDNTLLIDSLSPTNGWRHLASNYIQNERKLPTKGLYVCTKGDYHNRIVIPWYDKEGRLIFFNARTLSKKDDVLRYRKAPADVVSADDVLFMTEWPKPKTKVYIMEGEFDALTLKEAGFVACAIGGKFLSETQIEMLRPYEIVLAFDTDDGKVDWGKQAMINIGTQLFERGINAIRYVRPPKTYKDWNKLHVVKGSPIVRQYIEKFEKPFTNSTLLELRAA